MRCEQCYGVFPVTPRQAGTPLLCPFCPHQILSPAAGIPPLGKAQRFRYPRINKLLTL